MRALIILIVFIGLLYSCSNNNKEKLVIIFDRVDNLQKNSPVKIHGMDVGEVSSLKLVETGVLVKITLSDKKQVPVGSAFSIVNPIIGLAYVNIEPSKSTDFLTAKDTSEGKYGERGLLDNFMSDSTNRKKIQDVLWKIAEALKDLQESKKDSIIEVK